MKVLFNTYPMAFHTPGGGEMQLLAYKRYLPQFNIEVGLFDLWRPHFLDYNLVHFFSVMGGSWHFCHFVRQLKLPLLITSSLWITEETKQLYPWEEIKHQLQFANRIITNSDIESTQLAQIFSLPKEKFAVVYNGIDPVFFEPAAPDLFRKHFGIEFPFILNVGNIEPRKNQLNLLQAMKQFKNLKLVTIGHIRDKAYARQCLELGEEQFVFLGALDHDNPLLRSAYAACEAFALPSTLETPGLAALEAAAQGARIVITAVGAPREYFGKYAHYVEDPQNSDEIAAQLTQALATPAPGAALVQHMRSFAWEKTLLSLVDVYQQEGMRRA